MNASELKTRVEAAGTSPYYFTRKTMRFAGDTMRNYGVRGPLPFITNMGESVQVYELFRRKPVKNGLRLSAFFRADTFARTFGNPKA